MEKIEQDVKKITANEFTNVKDIKKDVLYTKDGYIFGYLRILYFNIELLPEEEQNAIAKTLTALAKGIIESFVYFTLPREVDLDSYKNYLEKTYKQEIENSQKKLYLNDMIRQAIELSSGSDNFEHQHFIKIWRKLKGNIRDDYQDEIELKNKLKEFQQMFSAVKIETVILNDNKIMELSNLFANGIRSIQNSSNDQLNYVPHTVLE